MNTLKNWLIRKILKKTWLYSNTIYMFINKIPEQELKHYIEMNKKMLDNYKY